MTQTHDANDVLMGGAGAPAWKFDEPGTTRVGTICSYPTTRQEREYDPNNPGGGALKFFPSGDPIMGIVIELQTDERTSSEDDGKRTFYVEGRYLKEAVRQGVKDAGGVGKLEVGGRLQVTFTHREDPLDKRSRKFWKVTYTPAAQAQLDGSQPPAAPAQQVQYLQTPQGIVDQSTGQIIQPTQSAPAAAPAQPPAAAGPTPEQVAAVRAAGLDPAAVLPGYTGG